MNTLEINAALRIELGKKAIQNIRKQGMVPCIICGKNETTHIQVPAKELKSLLHSSNFYKVLLKFLDGKVVEVFLQDFQTHPVTDEILHVDFIESIEDRKISVSIPVVFSGNSVGVLKGGSLRVNMRRVRVKGFPSKIPSELHVDVTDLDIGNKVYISTLREESYAFLHPDNAVIVQIKMSRAAMTQQASAEDKQA